MPEPYGSPEFRESLKYPDTRVGKAMKDLHDGLSLHGGFITALIENQFKSMGMGKPGEEPLDPMPFAIGEVSYTFSPTPHEREGLVSDDAIFVTRGNDSILLQVFHSESDPAQITDEVVLEAAGQRFEGQEAIEKIPTVFPEFASRSEAVAA